MDRFTPPLGWIRDLPDPRDLTPTDDEVRKLLVRLKRVKCDPPGRVDLRAFLAQVDDQGPLRSCAAHACTGLLSYFHRRATGETSEISRLFVYQMARFLHGWTGDSGASLRASWKAIVRFGTPPEEAWPFDPSRLDVPPGPALFAYTREVKGLRFVRLDPAESRQLEVLDRVRAYLAAGFPCVFGFIACDSLTREAGIPLPTIRDVVRGGQAVMAVGYDDAHRIRNKGALLVRGSWGTSWGNAGYGWLPYDYVRKGWATDFWTVVRPAWLKSGGFRAPRWP